MIHSYVMFKESDIINYWKHCKMHRNHRSLSLRIDTRGFGVIRVALFNDLWINSSKWDSYESYTIK